MSRISMIYLQNKTNNQNTFMKNKLLLTLSLFFLLLSQVWAQTQAISGKVTDTSTGQGLPGVTVLVKGTSAGTSTDVNGNYSITPPAGGTSLTFSFIGYTTIERVIGNNTSINVTLTADANQLDEVVVVGYGTQQKRDVTSSISQVKGTEIANLATPSFAQQLAGRATGVQVVQSSGILGAPPVIRVRGVNSISSNSSPLVVIDGVPVFSGNLGSYAPNNALADINPNDIESFEILKDGAATAIYGSRASNGVILVTTKQGRKGQVKFNYDNYAGWAQATKLHDLLNAAEFVEIKNEMARNASAATLPAALGTEDTDWNDYVYRTGFQQNHSFSASAGTDRTKYYVSLGYTNQEGIAVGNSLKRYTVRTNLDQNVTKWLDFGLQAGLSKQDNYGILTGSNSLSSNTFAVIRMLPNVGVYDANDPTGYNIDDANVRSLGRGPNAVTIANGIPNQRFIIDNNTRRSTGYRALGNVSLGVKLIDNLRFKTLLGADVSITDDFGYGDPRHGDAASVNGSLDQIFAPSSRWNWQNILTYNKSFNEAHNFDFTAVAEYTKERTSYYETYATGIADRVFNQNIISGTVANQFVYGDLEENGLASYLARVNYNYKSKYYLGASIRADGLSKLSPENRWGYFPGVSAAYRISEENFFKSTGLATYISDLRIRGSYAVVGNSFITGNYPYLGSYASAQYGSQSGIAFSNTGNPDLKWESQKISDIGVDLGLLDGRINLELAYWQKDNNDIVLQAPTAPSLGVPGNIINRNIGRVINNGVELGIRGAILNSDRLRWESGLNFSTQKNEVKELVNDQDIQVTTVAGTYTIIREGESINSIYGYQYEGVNMANGNPIYRKADGTLVQGDIATNSYRVYDPGNPSNPPVLSAASSLSSSDKVILGNTLPKWFGGFDNTVNYANFDLNFLLRFSGGNKIMNRTRQDLLTQLFENNGAEILGRWQSPENPGDGQTPRVWAGRDAIINSNGEASSRFVESGNFLKLSNITLGYSLPTSFLNRINVNRLRIFAQAQNILTVTKYTGLDPESYTTTTTATNFGVDYNSNPQQKVFTFGLNLGF